MLLVAGNPVTLEELRNVVKYRTRLQATRIKQDMGNLVNPLILNMGVPPPLSLTQKQKHKQREIKFIDKINN